MLSPAILLSADMSLRHNFLPIVLGFVSHQDKHTQGQLSNVHRRQADIGRKEVIRAHVDFGFLRVVVVFLSSSVPSMRFAYARTQSLRHSRTHTAVLPKKSTVHSLVMKLSLVK